MLESPRPGAHRPARSPAIPPPSRRRVSEPLAGSNAVKRPPPCGKNITLVGDLQRVLDRVQVPAPGAQLEGTPAREITSRLSFENLLAHARDRRERRRRPIEHEAGNRPVERPAPALPEVVGGPDDHHALARVVEEVAGEVVRAAALLHPRPALGRGLDVPSERFLRGWARGRGEDPPLLLGQDAARPRAPPATGTCLPPWTRPHPRPSFPTRMGSEVPARVRPGCRRSRARREGRRPAPRRERGRVRIPAGAKRWARR